MLFKMLNYPFGSPIAGRTALCLSEPDRGSGFVNDTVFCVSLRKAWYLRIAEQFSTHSLASYAVGVTCGNVEGASIIKPPLAIPATASMAELASVISGFAHFNACHSLCREMLRRAC